MEKKSEGCFTPGDLQKMHSMRSCIYVLFKHIFLTPMQRRFYELAVFPNHYEYEAIFQCIMKSWLVNGKKREEYDALVRKANNEKNHGKIDLSFELYKIRPLENLSVLEIGGYFCLNLAELGAEAVKMDSTINACEYISLHNYKDRLADDFFDITFSREVFDRHSGIDNEKDFDTASKELLTVFSLVTKNGGMTLHEGLMPEAALDKRFLEKISLQLIATAEGKRDGPVYNIYIFRKNRNC